MAYTAHIDTFARDNLPPSHRMPELLLERPEFRYPARMNCAAVSSLVMTTPPSPVVICLLG